MPHFSVHCVTLASNIHIKYFNIFLKFSCIYALYFDYFDSLSTLLSSPRFNLYTHTPNPYPYFPPTSCLLSFKSQQNRLMMLIQ